MFPGAELVTVLTSGAKCRVTSTPKTRIGTDITIRREPLPGSALGFAANIEQPGLDDVNVRRALALAIDRDAVLKATKLLDDAGWKLGSDGVRTKDGKRLSFTLVYSPSTISHEPNIRPSRTRQADGRLGEAVDLTVVLGIVVVLATVYVVINILVDVGLRVARPAPATPEQCRRTGGLGMTDTLAVDPVVAATTVVPGRVLIVRVTKKLSRLTGRATAPGDDRGTTLLGPWYATVLLWRPRVVQLVNESTLLPVLLHGGISLPDRELAATLRAFAT